MDKKDITAAAKKLHNAWLKENKAFVSLCQKDPLQTNNSRDFTRALPWKELPDVWKNHYQRRARIQLLTAFTAQTKHTP
jgi:hypothetical protein